MRTEVFFDDRLICKLLYSLHSLKLGLETVYTVNIYTVLPQTNFIVIKKGFVRCEFIQIVPKLCLLCS